MKKLGISLRIDGEMSFTLSVVGVEVPVVRHRPEEARPVSNAFV